MNSLLKEGISRSSRSLATGFSSDQIRLRYPTTDDELWDFVARYLNIRIPRVKVCDDHCAPFTAFADAFFARNPITVWKASRGFGGKSFNLAALATTEAILGAKVNLLGGSGEQAERVLNYIYGEEVGGVMLGAENAPRGLIKGGFERGTLKKKTDFTHNGYIRALMASSKSVRGPHPERLRLDEVDEMDLAIYDAAMGQTMALRHIPAQTVASSTWHNANGTMTEILRRAEDQDWPVYEWCYRENLASVGGWLPDDEVERKKIEVSKVMFEVEYDLQEPNPESRAIDTEAVRAMFDREKGEFKGNVDEEIRLGKPERGHVYLTGTDWAKRTDWTICLTYEELQPYTPGADSVPGDPLLRLVAFSRTGRKPWPVLVGGMEKRVKFYGENSESFSVHDETGIGDVIGDYLSEDTESIGVWMSGRLRSEILSDYIAAVEHGLIECPYIEWMAKEHEFASIEDVYGVGSTNHLPDTIAAAALAYYLYKNKPRKKRVRATWGS